MLHLVQRFRSSRICNRDYRLGLGIYLCAGAGRTSLFRQVLYEIQVVL
ncbi:hypothetical protein ADIS_3046 [Lunatimonas lonarensis]|uniref:Uncharacterized protein n=1 Tax=Lunatimonas lonarensis TaxID=1232681 RepID=R7ZR50_9BACT|nr:hypothetical protein ADIS_3046 [Lunatimonas lonarensis]